MPRNEVWSKITSPRSTQHTPPINPAESTTSLPFPSVIEPPSIVIDPPSFQRGSFVAEKDYRKVIRRLPELTAEGGQVMACHNDPKLGTEFLKEIMLEECPDFSFVERLKNPEDFPEAEPEKGLKVLLYAREG